MIVIVFIAMIAYLSVASTRISSLLDDILDAVGRQFVAVALLGACFSVDRIAISYFFIMKK